MQSAIPAQERPARNALTVALNYATRTRKSVMHAARSSVRPACPSIQCSTPKLHQRITGKTGSGKELNSPTQKWPSGQAAFSTSFPSFVHLSSALYLVTAMIRPYRSSLPHG